MAHCRLVRGRVRRRLARALLCATAEAGALLLLALLIGAGAYRLTAHGAPAITAPPQPSLERAHEWGQAVAAVRPPPLSASPLRTLRARPESEPEAVARFLPPAPADPDVHTIAQALSIIDASPPQLGPGERVDVTVSFYYCEHSEGPRGDGGGFCGLMRDGSLVFPGAAACHIDYLGQLFRIEDDPEDRIYRCADTGSAIAGLHRDIWFSTSGEGWRWQHAVGNSVAIEILPLVR